MTGYRELAAAGVKPCAIARFDSQKAALAAAAGHGEKSASTYFCWVCTGLRDIRTWHWERQGGAKS